MTIVYQVEGIHEDYEFFGADLFDSWEGALNHLKACWNEYATEEEEYGERPADPAWPEEGERNYWAVRFSDFSHYVIVKSTLNTSKSEEQA